MLQLWRYPVKSMQGERLREVAVGRFGFEGDRGCAMGDVTTGLVLTARRNPALLHAVGRRHADGTVEVVLPDGRTAGGDDDLSTWLGRPVRLQPASPASGPTYESDAAWEDDGGDWRRWDGPAGAFHDDGNVRVSLVGAGTISALGPASGAGGLDKWDVRRFRPNILVEGRDEDALIGCRVRLGGAILDVVQPVPRCVMVTRPQPDGIERDLDVLRTILRDRQGLLAVGAVVVAPGTVREGDAVDVIG